MSILSFQHAPVLYTPSPSDNTMETLPTVNESLYIDHNTMSGVAEVPIYKRVNSLRLSSTLVDTSLEEERDLPEISNFVPFLAKITENSQTLQQNQWYYGWTEMQYSSSTYGAIVVKNGGLVGSAGDSTTRALNVMEWGNNANCVAPGVCLSVAECDYPEGWSLRAIGDCLSGPIEPVVIMYKVRQNDTGPFGYVFQAENAHDGICPTGIPGP